MNSSITRLLALVLLALGLAACSEPDDTELVQRAQAYLQEAKTRAAALELRNALQRNPDNAQARFLLGQIHLDTGDGASAAKEFRRAEQLGWDAAATTLGHAAALLQQRDAHGALEQAQVDNNWPATAQANLHAVRALAWLMTGDRQQAQTAIQHARELDGKALYLARAEALALMMQQQYSEAQQRLAAALQQYPGNQDLLLLQASNALLANDRDTALSAYARVIAAQPPAFVTRNGRQAYLGSARVHILNQDYAAALENLQPLLKQGADDPEINYLMGVVAFEQQDFDQAEVYLRKILKLAPNHEPTLLLFGAVSYAQGKFEQAAYHLSKYLSAQPDNRNARKLLGRTYIALEQPERARQALAAAGDTASRDDAELLALIGVSELQGGRTQAGIASLEKAVSMQPDSAALRQQLAQAYLSRGDTPQAIEQLERLIAADDDSARRAGMMVVFAYLRDGDQRKALARAEAMLQAAPNDAGLLTLMGVVHSAAGDSKAARAYFEQAVQQQPGHVGALTSLARMAIQQGRPEEAADYYQRILQARPDHVPSMMALAQLAQQQGNSEDWLRWLQQARQTSADSIDARVLLAEYYLRQGELGRVETLIREMQEAGGESYALLAVRAQWLIAGKRYQQAVTTIRQMIELRSKLYVGHYLLGLNYYRMGQPDAAISSLSRAHTLAPDDLRTGLLLAQLQLRQRDAAGALRVTEAVLQAHPQNASLLSLQGEVYLALGRYAEAAAVLDQAWQSQPSPALLIRRFDASRKLKGTAASLPLLQQWLQQHPDDVVVRLKLAETYQINGQPKQAVEQYAILLEQQPDNVVVLNNIAWMYHSLGDERALEVARRAHELNQSAAIQDTYGWILLQNGQTDKAVALLKQAADAMPGVADVQYHYAVALHQAGDRQQARKLLQSLLDSGVRFEGREQARRLLQQ